MQGQCGRDVRVWPKAAVPECLLSRRCWGLSRRERRRVSLLSLHARWRKDHENASIARSIDLDEVCPGVCGSLSGAQKSTRQARWRVRETRYNRYINTSLGPPRLPLSLGHRILPKRGISCQEEIYRRYDKGRQSCRLRTFKNKNSRGKAAQITDQRAFGLPFYRKPISTMWLARLFTGDVENRASQSPTRMCRCMTNEVATYNSTSRYRLAIGDEFD
jgi:hypothetical protein